MSQGAVVLTLALAIAASQPPRTVKGQYRLPAKGFAVVVPRNATGLLEVDPEVERGVRIALTSGGSVLVYGEMNSLEWSTPVEGVRWVADAVHPECTTSPVSDAHVGTLIGAGMRLLCGARVIRYALAFRPAGGPIYWLRLETSTSQEAAEAKVFEQIAASFRLIRWE